MTHRNYLREDGGLTRHDLSLISPAELAIIAAVEAVEASGASVALTDAVKLLDQARNRVADHFEDRL